MKPWKRILLIGIIVAITSQFYFNILLEGFRVSAAVILFPVLLMTMGKDQKCLKLGVVTGITVFILRFVIYLGRIRASSTRPGRPFTARCSICFMRCCSDGL